MRIAVVDDEKSARYTLRSLLTSYLDTFNLETDLQEFSSGEEFLENFIPGSYSICFLDIHMKALTGMDIARIIFKHDPDCRIIFLTVTSAYLADGYEVRAWRYLLKPLTYEKLERALAPLLENLTLPGKALEVKVRGKEYSIPLHKIYYAITMGRNIEIHFESGFLTLSSHTTFSQISVQLLKDSHFVLCGKGLLTNISYILHIEDNKLIMKNGKEIFASRRKLPEIRSLFLEHALENF